MVNFAHHAMSPVPCPTPIRPLIDGTFPKNVVSEAKSRSEFKIVPQRYCLTLNIALNRRRGTPEARECWHMRELVCVTDQARYWHGCSTLLLTGHPLVRPRQANWGSKAGRQECT